MPMKRREAREAAFALIYEAGFRSAPEEMTPEACREIYDLAVQYRELEENEYVKSVFFGIWSHITDIDTKINEKTMGWKADRLSRVSAAIMRLCAYEMLYGDIPYNIAINEAVELAKKFDHDKAPTFINGVLNAIADGSGIKK